MSKFSFFSDLVNTLFDKKNRKKNFNFLFEKKQNKSLLEYIENVNDAKGEISALSYSEELLDYLSQCDHKTLVSFFEYLEKDYDLEINSIEEVLKNYNKKKEYNFYKDIKKISESKRLEIFRRLNSTQHGTINLVKLREKLLDLLDKYPNFRKIDFDLSSLFKDWFNRGFLILKPIDWETPANILALTLVSVISAAPFAILFTLSSSSIILGVVSSLTTYLTFAFACTTFGDIPPPSIIA